MRRESDSPEIRLHEVPFSPVERLVAATRVSREALHDLVRRIRLDREAWQRTAAEIPTRRRLTVRQRARLQGTLRRAAARGDADACRYGTVSRRNAPEAEGPGSNASSIICARREVSTSRPTNPPACPADVEADADGERRRFRRLSGPSAGRILTSSSALFNTILINVTTFFRDAEVWEIAAHDDPAGAARALRTDHTPDPGMERRLRLGPGSLLARHAARRSDGARRVPRSGQDLRDRRGRGGARRGAPRASTRPSRSPMFREDLLNRYFERSGGDLVAVDRDIRAVGDLRPARPDPGRADLARRSVALPQHADVLQCRSAGAGHVPLRLFAQPRRAIWSSAAPRCSSATAGMFKPVDLKQRIFRAAAEGQTTANGSRWSRSRGGRTSCRTQVRTTSGCAKPPSTIPPRPQMVVDPAGASDRRQRRGPPAVSRIGDADIGSPLHTPRPLLPAGAISARRWTASAPSSARCRCAASRGRTAA